MSSGPIILRAADLPDILEDEGPLLKLAFTEESLALFRRVLNLKFFQVRARDQKKFFIGKQFGRSLHLFYVA
jgi:hypothetical protein